MPSVAMLTLPFCTKHPHVTVDVKSMTSVQIQASLDKFELDAGMTYLENEPLSNVRQKMSTAETNCARWRRESVPVGLREKGREALVIV